MNVPTFSICRWGACLMVVLALLSTCRPGWCGPNTLATSLSVAEKSNDNLFFTEKERVSDTQTVVAPELVFNRRGERDRIALTARFTGNSFRENSELDAVDRLFQGEITHGFSERFQLSSAVELSRDSLVDRDMETTGLLIHADERKRYLAQLTPVFSWSDTYDVFSTFHFKKEQYDSDEYVDFTGYGVRTGLTHTGDMEALFYKNTASLAYDRYDYPDAEIGYASFLLESTSSPSELWRVKCVAGVRHVEKTSRVRTLGLTEDHFLTLVTNEKREEKWGGTGALRLTRMGEFLNVSGELSHDLEAMSGSDGMVGRSRATVHSDWRLSQELEAHCGARLFFNRSETEATSGNDVDEVSSSLYTLISWRSKEKWLAEFSYSHSRLDNQVTDEEKARNIFFVRFRYNFKY